MLTRYSYYTFNFSSEKKTKPIAKVRFLCKKLNKSITVNFSFGKISLSNQFNQTYFYPFFSFCKRKSRCVFFIKVYLWKSKILLKFKFEHLNSYHQTKKCICACFTPPFFKGSTIRKILTCFEKFILRYIFNEQDF